MKYYYTYKITLTQGSLKGKFYFGKHSTTKLNDNYKGSGVIIKQYYKKYPKGYIKEILAYYNSEEELNKAEKDIIIKYINDENCLNIHLGGNGGDTYTHQSEERKQEIYNKRSASLKGKNKGKHCPVHQKQYLSEINTGKSLSVETRNKMSKSKSGENNPFFGKGYTRLGENHPLYGKHRVYDNPERTKYHYE